MENMSIHLLESISGTTEPIPRNARNLRALREAFAFPSSFVSFVPSW
jgi:hypothetical protein